MKVYFEYDLDDYEDREYFHLASHARDLYSVLWKFDQYLHSKVEHGHSFKDTEDAICAIRSKLMDIMDDKGVDFDMLS